MAFKLKNKSPLLQSSGPMDRFKPTSNPGRMDNMQKSLSASNKTIKKAVANRKPMSIGDKIASDWNNQNSVVKAVTQFADPTGVSSYPEVNKAWSDGKFSKEDILEPLGALPIIGKIPKIVKGAVAVTAGAKLLSKATKINKATRVVNKTNNVLNTKTIADAAGSSPLRQQKLSPLAAKKKAARDLAYAKTDDRRKKKAHAQRMHRKDPAGKGKDWDHKDQRWESAKQNRGNDGLGTKKESGKKYKTK